jgi:hypothetical protein
MGNLANISHKPNLLSLGAVTVLASRTQGQEFIEPDGGPGIPVGNVYFYLIQYRFADGTASGYGSDSAAVSREPASCDGGCP